MLLILINTFKIYIFERNISDFEKEMKFCKWTDKGTDTYNKHF